MSIHYPYRAVICGEEHIVKGWRGRKLLTDKGSFSIGHIYGAWQIKAHRLFEVALIQADGQGGWLLNGKALSFLEKLTWGVRFSEISSDENLRVRKDQIQAVAWFDKTGNSKNVTELLDEVVNFWVTASSPPVEPTEEESVGRLFGQLAITLHFTQKYRELFAGVWSDPVWLTEFHPAIQKIPLSPQQKQLANVASELQQTKEQLRKSQAAANDTLKQAMSKWMRFDPPRMSAETKARITKAVQMYSTDNDKRSLKKIAAAFGVSRKTVSLWFKQFTAETGYPVVTHHRHISVKEHTKLDLEQSEEDEED